MIESNSQGPYEKLVYCLGSKVVPNTNLQYPSLETMRRMLALPSPRPGSRLGSLTDRDLPLSHSGVLADQTSTDRGAAPCFPGQAKGLSRRPRPAQTEGQTPLSRQAGRQAGRQSKLSRRPGPAQTQGQSPLSQAGGAVSWASLTKVCLA
jgi:hypothetical protein